MRPAALMLATIAFVAMIIGCGPQMVEVQSGDKVICFECGKVIYSDVQTRQVPATEASKYSVHEIKKLCSECQAKEAEKQRVQRGGNIVGEWIWENPIRSIKVVFRSDGTGRWECPDADIKWQPTADGFTATADWVDYGKERRSRFSGRLIEGGRKLYVEGFGIGGFGGGNMMFEKFG